MRSRQRGYTSEPISAFVLPTAVVVAISAFVTEARSSLAGKHVRDMNGDSTDGEHPDMTT